MAAPAGSTRLSGDVEDPWKVGTADDDGGREVPRWFRLAASAVVGAAGPVARLAVDGFHGRAAVLCAIAIGWVLLVDRRPAGPVGLLMLAGVGVAAPLATWSGIGRAPVLVALFGVIVAHAVLVDWRPLPGWPPRTSVVAGLAMLPLVAGGVIWFRHERLLLSAGLLILALVVVEAYHRRPSVMEQIDDRFVRVLIGIASAVGAAVLLVVVTVTLYLPGVIGAALDRIRRTRGRDSYWTTRRIGQGQIVRDARRPFASADPRTRLTRNLVGAVVLVGLAGAVTVLVVDRRSAQQDLADLDRSDVFERSQDVRFSELAAYEGVEFADRLKDEQDVLSNEYLRSSDVGDYDVADFVGAFTNVTDGVRRTIETPSCVDCPELTVWIAGGSAAFGLGQRDEHTIASELVRLGADDGAAVEVVNLGVPGWTLHQEVQKVRARLASGAPAPDLVVFFNGYNDVVGTVMDSTVNGVRPEEPAFLRTEVIREFTEVSLDPNAAGTPEELGGLAATKYEREAVQITSRLADDGIGAAFVFQPDALAADAQYRFVSSIYEIDENVRDHLDGSLETAAQQLDGRAVNLRHLLDDGPPVFADLVHTNELGARRVAESLYLLIVADLVDERRTRE